MRGMGFFMGRDSRNRGLKLADPHPVADLGNAVHTGDAGKDGYTRLSVADPDRQGLAPPVAGTQGPVFAGPDQSWEQ